MNGEFRSSYNLNSPTRFADQLQGILGEDSDLNPVFLEESWTLGVAAAMELRQQRRQSQFERERQACDLRALNPLETLSFIDAGEWLGGLAHLAAQMAAAREAAGARPAAQSPQMGEGLPTQTAASAQTTETTELESMAEHSARRLLRVTPSSTREQLRAAYRRMAVAWHPDRIERGSDTLRRQATERMAAINEAYRLLRGNLSAEPA